LATDAPSYSNSNITFTYEFDPTNPNRQAASDTFRLAKMLTNIPFGTTEFSILINDFPPTGIADGNYRIVFKSESVSRIDPSPGTFHAIESYLKDIVLEEAQAQCLQIVGMSSPLPNCNLNDQIMSFRVRNRGLATPASYNICYQISTDNGITFGAPICQVFSTSIPFDSVIELSFSALQSFSAPLTLINAWAAYSGITSDTLRNVPIYRTTVQTVPYYCSFDYFAVFREWSIIPGKITQPHVSWHIPTDGSGAMAGRIDIATSGEASNDRLVSGCIELEAGKLYQISFVYNAHTNRNAPNSSAFSRDATIGTTENLSLYVGRSKFPDEANDITLMSLQGFNNTDPRTMTVYFTPTETGIYHFGFLAHSEVLSAGISIHDFLITEAQKPLTVPIYMGFESRENFDDWQTYSQNAIDSTVSATLMRGWMESTAPVDIFSGRVGLRTLSAPGVDPNSSTITALETNNNWLISPPIFFEADNAYEIRYFRRAMNNLQEEILNIRVSNHLELQTLSESTPLFSDTARSIVYALQRVYFTPTVSGVYFVTFQYNSADRRGSPLSIYGMSLDEIAIQDSVSAQDTNLSVIDLRVPDPDCTLPDNAEITLTVKNRTEYTIPAGRLTAFFEVTNPSGVPTVYRMNNPSTAFFGEIGPFETREVSRRGLDMSALGTWEVRGWISGDVDKSSIDDTSAVVQTSGTGEHAGRYSMGFEPDENINFWSYSQIGNSRLWWSFINNPAAAHTGTGVAYLPPSTNFIAGTDSVRQYIVSPCLRFYSDTTYFISFYYRMARS